MIKNKKIAIASSTLLILFSSIIVTPTAYAAICGFDGVTSNNLGGGEDGLYEEAIYTNCSDHNEKIRVNYFYDSEERCVSPGETRLSVNPDLGALVGADPLGPC